MSISDYSIGSEWTTEDEDIIVDPKLSKLIAIKATIAFITLVIGALLALLINATMEVQTLSPEVLPETRISDVDIDLYGRPIVGVFQSKYHNKLCLDTWNRPTNNSPDHQIITVWHCHRFFVYNQNFAFTKSGQLKQGKYCLEFVEKNGSYLGEMALCNKASDNQFWVWLQDDMLYNPYVKMCLSVGNFSESKEFISLVSKRCDKTDDNQRWIFKPIEFDNVFENDDFEAENKKDDKLERNVVAQEKFYENNANTNYKPFESKNLNNETASDKLKRAKSSQGLSSR